MEIAVTIAILAGLHRFGIGLDIDRASHVLEVGAIAVHGGEFYRLQFDMPARFHELDGSDIGLGCIGTRSDLAGARRSLEDLHAVSDSNRDLPYHLERDERFADRGPTDTELLRQFAL